MYFYGATGSNLTLWNITVSDLVASNSVVNGGVAFVGAGILSIRSSQFLNFTQAKAGGAFCLQFYEGSSTDVSVIYCMFSGISAAEDGGAIVFGVNSSFVINGTSFVNCTSLGHGGAFASSSTSSGSRKIVNCLFERNSALSHIGMDIYDSSNRANTYYNDSSVWGSISRSAHSPEVLLFAGTKV
jgi:hypothetical protein